MPMLLLLLLAVEIGHLSCIISFPRRFPLRHYLACACVTAALAVLPRLYSDVEVVSARSTTTAAIAAAATATAAAASAAVATAWGERRWAKMRAEDHRASLARCCLLAWRRLTDQQASDDDDIF